MTLEEHYKAQAERWEAEAHRYKGMLFDAWQSLRGQSKGLQRQRRLIRRLQAINARLLAERTDYEIMQARTRASKRGATPLDVQRAVLALYSEEKGK